MPPVPIVVTGISSVVTTTVTTASASTPTSRGSLSSCAGDYPLFAVVPSLLREPVICSVTQDDHGTTRGPACLGGADIWPVFGPRGWDHSSRGLSDISEEPGGDTTAWGAACGDFSSAVLDDGPAPPGEFNVDAEHSYSTLDGCGLFCSTSDEECVVAGPPCSLAACSDESSGEANPAEIEVPHYEGFDFRSIDRGLLRAWLREQVSQGSYDSYIYGEPDEGNLPADNGSMQSSEVGGVSRDLRGSLRSALGRLAGRGEMAHTDCQ